MEQAVVEAAVLQAAQTIEDQLDQQIHSLDNLDQDDIERLRASRLTQLKKHAEKKAQWKERGHGEVQHIQSEKEFFACMKGEDRMVCHFYRENWPCKVMDKHLATLCTQHFECKFAKIDAEKSPYLTEKLKIWMLPTLALIRNEKTVDYVVGFDDLGGRDDFATEVLAARLAAAGVVDLKDACAGAGVPQSTIRKGEFVTRAAADDEDSDFEL